MPRDQDWNERNLGRGRDQGREDRGRDYNAFGEPAYDEGRSWEQSRQDSWRGQHVEHQGPSGRDYGDGGRGGSGLEGYGRARIAGGGYGQRGYGETGVAQNANDQGGLGQGGFGQAGVNQGDYGYRGDLSGDERGGRDAGGYRPYGYGRDRADRYGYDSYGRREAPIGAQANPTLSEITNGEHRGRGPKNYTRSDERIREDVSDRLADAGDLDASEIEVAVSDGEVTLSGGVHDRRAKRRAEDLADDVSGVKHVQNNLRLTGNETLNGLTADAARI